MLYKQLKKDKGKMDASLRERIESILKERGLDLDYAKSNSASFGMSGFVMGLHEFQFGLMVAVYFLMSLAVLFGLVSSLGGNSSFSSEDVMVFIWGLAVWAFTYLLICYLRALYGYYRNIVRLAIVINVLNFVLVSAMGYFENDYEMDYTMVWSALIPSALWIAYFMKSKRVKNTFTLDYNPFRFGRTR